MSGPRLIRRYADMLALFERGDFLAACDDALAKTLEGLESNGKEQGIATMTVTVKIAYQKGILNFYPSFDVKMPKVIWGVTPAWSMGGAISVQHPDQVSMFDGPRPVSAAEQ